ncbi:unnamed protein product [Lupinus luteus]|uniref:Uncharacterized protein n=1 Tax=Lupinus luteus TaxID=3873 RepID=A0AAV1YDK2_LUPLU
MMGGVTWHTCCCYRTPFTISRQQPPPQPPPPPPQPPLPLLRLRSLSTPSSSTLHHTASLNYNQQQEEEEEEDKEVGISKIQVPRHKHIPISKSHLLDAILSNIPLHHSYHFPLISKYNNYSLTYLSLFLYIIIIILLIHYIHNHRCLDSILHAEHKTILEDMRSDYQLQSQIHSDDDHMHPPSPNLMHLLSQAQFEELSVRDLMLTSALNSDYLLTLPIYVDWKRAYESNAIIFRRGYATEKQKGLLIVEKLDYLQSLLLRTIFFIISKPLGKLGSWTTELFQNAGQNRDVQSWTERLRLWLKELSVFQKSSLYNEHASDEQRDANQEPIPIWLAAQRAVARYEGILSPVGPRERLFRRLLSWIGLIPPTPETPFEVHNDSNTPEPYLRPTFLSRISLSDIWRPATGKYCQNNPWKMFKTAISILFSQSVLQEPAFEELILLYTNDVGEPNAEDKAEVPSLQLKIYERIPIPDLPVIFPHKKLSFRIIDTVRLDIATILGLLAYFINYKFENVSSAPSAILLDVVAVSALIIYGSRVVLGYKQTWDRYQLLVNKTLYEKTLASGFGSVHFILDASEQQQYKEAILAYAVLLKSENGQVISRQSLGEKCERFMYEVFKVKVEMPIDKALNTLLRLSLATETCVDGRHGVMAIPCPKAYESLKERWNSLLSIIP